MCNRGGNVGSQVLEHVWILMAMTSREGEIHTAGVAKSMENERGQDEKIDL